MQSYNLANVERIRKKKEEQQKRDLKYRRKQYEVLKKEFEK